MKRISTIIMALVVVMTMAQCKKDSPTTPDNQNNVVTITLDVKSNNGSRVDVNTTTGTVDFETGDKVYVGSGGKYVGFLTHNGTNFVGNITNPTENQPLQFYFLGNVTPTETLSAGTTEECSVIISDQTEHLPVISCASSNENYVSGLTSYTGHLLNKCALAKFNVTTPSNSPICITGMKNKVTVDFSQNAMTPSIDGNGVIMLPAGSGENVEKWAILLPQEALEEGEEGSVYSEDGLCVGIRPAIPAIAENNYFADGINITLDGSGTPVVPEGAIDGLFTINANGNQVYFSKGNLQYIGSAGNGDVNNTGAYWKFAENQWDYIGTSQNGTGKKVDRDLFAWGTSNYNHGAQYYQPWAFEGPTADACYYAYGSVSYNLFEQTGQADWGYNCIINGCNVENFWRTLTREEWFYLLNTRSTTSNMLYAKCCVNEINGVLLFPDNWDTDVLQINEPNNKQASFDTNVIALSQWDLIAQHGVVFLPAPGYISYTTVYDQGDYGFYWTSSCNGTSSAVYCTMLQNTDFYAGWSSNRGYGFSVRLVHDYNP